jgi:crossover junction endodeoxyribonuclease RuvC
MRTLGIDPGLGTTGYAVLDGAGSRPRLIEAGAVIPGKGKPLEQRILAVYRGVKKVIEEFSPDVIAVEDLFSHYRNPRTAIIMAHARGAVYLCAAEMGVPVCAYPARKVKQDVVGSGGATKRQVQKMIQTIFALAEPPEPDDVADATAVALCHARSAFGPQGARR